MVSNSRNPTPYLQHLLLPFLLSNVAHTLKKLCGEGWPGFSLSTGEISVLHCTLGGLEMAAGALLWAACSAA